MTYRNKAFCGSAQLFLSVELQWSQPASISKLIGQIDVGKEVRSNGGQGLYFSLNFILLHQFHLKQKHITLRGMENKAIDKPILQNDLSM